MICKQRPECPFQQIAADLASYGGKQFVNCKTDWPDIVEMGNDTTAPKLARGVPRGGQRVLEHPPERQVINYS